MDHHPPIEQREQLVHFRCCCLCLSALWRNSARPQKRQRRTALHLDGARRTARRRSRERPSARSGGGLEPTAVIPGYCDHAPDSRRKQPTLIRTRDCPMANQCDAEPMRASRARSRSLLPDQQSTRPVHRPVRTQATGEASKPGSCFSNVAAGTPAGNPRPLAAVLVGDAMPCGR